MNLENLGVQELNAKEMKTIDGGFVGFVVRLVLGTMRYTLPVMAETAAGGGTTIGNIGGAK